MDLIIVLVESLGVAILCVGIVWSFGAAGVQLAGGRKRGEVYESLRKTLGRSILLGLEVLVVADLIHTVVVDRTLDNVLGLGLIVLVRTLLSFTLEVEIDGTLPWKQSE